MKIPKGEMLGLRDRIAAKAIISTLGGYSKVARLLGLHPSTVFRWNKIPADRIVEIEEKTSVPREILRPDLYRQEIVEEV